MQCPVTCLSLQAFRQLKRYSKQQDFNPETVGHVSLACRCICEWVLALEHYNDVYKVCPSPQTYNELQTLLSFECYFATLNWLIGEESMNQGATKSCLSSTAWFVYPCCNFHESAVHD